MRRDGHTHTELCPHGSGDAAEEMVQRAISLGFEAYAITEHAPLPPGFADRYAGAPTGLTEAAIDLDDVPAYLALTRRLRRRFGDRMAITVGFEVDFLDEFADWTRGFLDEYGPEAPDGVLSVHFLRGRGGCYWCVDDTADDFRDGLLADAEGPQDLYARYLDQVLASVEADLGSWSPPRIGHMTLVKKFQDRFGLPVDFDAGNRARIDHILGRIAAQGRQLDLNASGLYKPYCNETYPDAETIAAAARRGIGLVYGSDAHSIAEVGHGYHTVMALARDGRRCSEETT